jgi:hypothetical protein
MKAYDVSCDFSIEANSEEEAYEKLLEYLAICVFRGNLKAFELKAQEAA